jgi:hypothetical protein
MLVSAPHMMVTVADDAQTRPNILRPAMPGESTSPASQAQQVLQLSLEMTQDVGQTDDTSCKLERSSVRAGH